VPEVDPLVARHGGLDPSAMQSGQIARRGPISKNGSRRLRTALVEAAYSVVRHELGDLGRFGRRLAPVGAEVWG
jgi:transposase